MRSEYNGFVYEIPLEVMDSFVRFVKEEWDPVMSADLVTENGVKRIPTNVIALSWNQLLKEKYTKEWICYRLVKG